MRHHLSQGVESVRDGRLFACWPSGLAAATPAPDPAESLHFFNDTFPARVNNNGVLMRKVFAP